METHINIDTEACQLDEQQWQTFLAHMGQEMKCPLTTIVSLTFTDNATLRELNSTYRGIDKPTDVLSFPQGMENDLLGDIVISVETAKVQAQEKGHSLDHELAILTAHGLLHLLGYDHAEPAEEKIMFALQERLVQQFWRHL